MAGPCSDRFRANALCSAARFRKGPRRLLCAGSKPVAKNNPRYESRSAISPASLDDLRKISRVPFQRPRREIYQPRVERAKRAKPWVRRPHTSARAESPIYRKRGEPRKDANFAHVSIPIPIPIPIPISMAIDLWRDRLRRIRVDSRPFAVLLVSIGRTDAHRDGTGFQPSVFCWGAPTWGVARYARFAPGWYEVAPLALPEATDVSVLAGTAKPRHNRRRGRVRRRREAAPAAAGIVRTVRRNSTVPSHLPSSGEAPLGATCKKILTRCGRTR